MVDTTSGEQGLKLVESSKPDIMLLDLLLGAFTGFDVLERLRGFSQLPIIVFTARSDMGALAVEEGANGFMAKPFKPEQLMRKIEDTLDAHKTKA